MATFFCAYQEKSITFVNTKNDTVMAQLLPENIDLDNPEFQNAWQLITKSHQSVFLTGKAGTGKSTFLRYICENTHKKYVILAPTGIAAVNVGGVTLHSFFKMPLKPLLHDDPEFSLSTIRKTLRYPRDKVKIIKELELIIIDEISMVRADMIDFIDKVLRIYSGNMREPFGGKQLLFVGDVFQLEPVITSDMREILKRYYRQSFFFNANAFSTIDLVSIELQKIYRQNNQKFISLLDRIRINKISPEDISDINSRYNPIYKEDKDEFVITLATRRDTVDIINEAHLKDLTTPEYKYRGIINNDFPSQNLPTSLELILKEGAQVIFIKNDKEQRWVNGTLGRVYCATKDGIEIELENGDIHTLSLETWENIQYTYDEKEKTIKEKTLGTFQQFPIKPAWALTVHKSQGLTFNKVIIDFVGGAFTGGQTYVALSRCTAIEGIILKQQLRERDVFVNPAIIEFSKRFNNNKVIESALDRAAADASYHDAAVAFDNNDLDNSVKSFSKAVVMRNELGNPIVQRLMRRKLNIITTLRTQINLLKNTIHDQNLVLRNLADEYAVLGEDSLNYTTENIVMESQVNYGNKNNSCEIDSVTVRAAMANFDKALSLDNLCIKALTGKGNLYIRLGEPAEAIICFEKILTIDPNSIVANFKIGIAFISLKKYPDALKSLKRALKYNKVDPTIHDEIALVYDKIGLEELSERHAQLAKKLRDKNK
ncbi:MAG: AAA family ATPase [Muribaculaceae bacterium]